MPSSDCRRTEHAHIDHEMDDPDPRVVEKLAAWLLEKKPWAYTGHKSTRSNAKPKEIWVRFYKDTEVWWFEHFRLPPADPATDQRVSKIVFGRIVVIRPQRACALGHTKPALSSGGDRHTHKR